MKAKDLMTHFGGIAMRTFLFALMVAATTIALGGEASQAPVKSDDLTAIFNLAKANGQRIACMSKLKELALAVGLYAKEHKGKLPDHRNLKKELASYVKNEDLWVCPSSSPDYSRTSFAKLISYRL